MGKQAYKLDLLTKWKIYDVFHVSLLKQDIMRKGQIDNSLEPKREFKVEDSKYKVKAIIYNVVYDQ